MLKRMEAPWYMSKIKIKKTWQNHVQIHQSKYHGEFCYFLVFGRHCCDFSAPSLWYEPVWFDHTMYLEASLGHVCACVWVYVCMHAHCVYDTTEGGNVISSTDPWVCRKTEWKCVCVQFEVSLSNNNGKKMSPRSSEIQYKKMSLTIWPEVLIKL